MMNAAPADDFVRDEDAMQVDEQKSSHNPILPSVVSIPAAPVVDRRTTCPMLVRLFYRRGQHFPIHVFEKLPYPPEMLLLYTWMDATVLELSELIKSALPNERGAMTLRLIQRDPVRGHLNSRIWGSVQDKSKERTLAQIGFRVGDFVDACFLDSRRRS